MTAPAPAIVARDLAFHVGAVPLVLELSLTVAPGELVAIAGPNGAGKSTLLGLLAGELRPSAGAVSFFGAAHASPTELARRRAVLTQSAPGMFALTVLEIVLLGRLPHGDHDLAAAWDALGRVDARHLAGRSFPTLSGGEQQRVRLARALCQLAGTAGLLLLDEPTTSLDLGHAHALYRLVRAEAARGTAVVVVEHDLAHAALADRLVVMKRGRAVAIGDATLLTPALLADVFDIAGALVRLPSGRMALDYTHSAELP